MNTTTAPETARPEAEVNPVTSAAKGMPQAPENPYLHARRHWNEHVAREIADKRMWQFIGLGCLAIAAAAVGGIVYIGAQSRFVPYVVEVDKLGQSVAVGRADRAAPADPRVIRSTLASFISDARLVTPDTDVQRAAVFRVYAHLGPQDPGTQQMNEWWNGTAESSPFKRAAKETVSTEIDSVLPQSAETWQVEWTETVRERPGSVLAKRHMRALLSIYTVPPTPATTDEQMRQNPLGIYVREFSWSEIR
jgi:type IV secretory pathway TrbF-like protein